MLLTMAALLPIVILTDRHWLVKCGIEEGDFVTWCDLDCAQVLSYEEGSQAVPRESLNAFD